jgi:RHS repeat-associated protein
VIATGVQPSLVKNRVRGSRGYSANRTGASSDLSPTSRWGCGPCSYDFASARLVYPNGLSSNFTYDDLNRLTTLNATKAAYNYTLGPTGNRQSAAESINGVSGRTLNWSYDGIYRLTNETISLDPRSKNGTVNYGLDPVGNRLSQDSTLPGISTGAATFDANDQLSTEQYDNNGNTIQSGPRTFAYDSQNRVKSMGNNVTITYDGDGNRVSKTVSGVTTRYLVDELNPTGLPQVVEELVGNAVQRIYTYGKQRINQNQVNNSAWTPSFYGYDGLGSVRTLTDAAGTVTDTYDYDAWGNAVSITGSTLNVYLYRGEQYDPDLGLYYLRARHFNPITGRFLSRDPADGGITDPRTLHKYLYAAANPINLTDPTGRSIGGTLILGEISLPGAIALGTAAALGLACVAEPVVAGLDMGLGTALGYEVYDVKTVGPPNCPILVTFSWRQKVDSLPRPAPRVQPRVCTPQRQAELEAEKDAACNGAKGKCKPGDKCITIGLKIVAKAACIGARVDVMLECFSGGDIGHQIQVDQMVKEISDCAELKKTCQP